MTKRAAFVIAILSAAQLSAEEPHVEADIITMGRIVSVSIGTPTAFSQYREVPQGLVFPLVSFEANRGMHFFRFHATDAGERDRSIDVSLGQLERWRIDAGFDQFPTLHVTRAAPVHNYFEHGRLVIPDAVQLAFETAGEAEIPGMARHLISELGRRRLGVQRNRLRARFDLQITNNWSVYVSGREEARNGQRPVSFGAFEDGPSFSLIGFEVPAAVEIRTSDIGAGTSFHRPRYGFDADFLYSRFRNSIADILYDNPFRLNDALGPLQASRFISADWPSSLSTSAIVSGYFSPLDDLRLASTIAWSRISQDELFTSYTLNTVMPAPGFPEGLGPVNKETLPRRSLQGRVRTLTMDHALAWQLNPRMRVTVDYRDLDTADQTPDLTFPGYAAKGDAVWRTDFDDQPLTRPPLSLRKRQAAVEVEWTPVKLLTMRAGYRNDDRQRGGRRGGSTEQQSIHGRAIARFASGSSAVVSFDYSDRTPGALTFPVPFDLAGRQRTAIRAQGDWMPRGQESFGVTASIVHENNRYDPGAILRTFDLEEASLALRWFLWEDTTFTGDVTRSQIRHSQEWTEVPVERLWHRTTEDDLTDVGLSYEDSFREGRISVAFRATGSFASQRTQTRSVDAMPVDRDWPDVRNGLRDIAGGIEYAFSERFRVGLQHIYEIYSVDDFAWKTLSPYPLDALDDDTDARRLLFLDVRGGGYHAHQVGLYVRTTFQ